MPSVTRCFYHFTTLENALRIRAEISCSSLLFVEISPPLPYQIKSSALFQFSMTLSPSSISCLSASECRYRQRNMVLRTFPNSYGELETPLCNGTQPSLRLQPVR